VAGTMELESFMPASRLNMDSIRSPMMEARPTTKPSRAPGEGNRLSQRILHDKRPDDSAEEGADRTFHGLVRANLNVQLSPAEALADIERHAVRPPYRGIQNDEKRGAHLMMSS